MTPPQKPPGVPPAKWEGPPPTLLISTHLELHAFLNCCHHAQTWEAFSLEARCTVWIPLNCNQWSCRYCATRKIAQLARRTATARPNRLLTLTVDPSLWEDPRDAFDGTRRHLPDLARSLRTKFGEFEYLRVTELTRRGWPHYHLLVRSPYLPHVVVRDRWKELTGATIVDLRQVKQTFVAYTYLVKYLSKMHKIGWTNRHVSYSRSFFPPQPETDRDDLQLREGKLLETHPATLLYHQFRGSKLTQLRYNVFALDPSPDALRQATAPPLPLSQVPPKASHASPPPPPPQQRPPPDVPVLFPKHTRK